MKNLVALLCVVSALSVNSLMSNSCLNRAGDKCESEKSVDCGNVDKCLTISGFSVLNNVKTRFIYKGCPGTVKCEDWLCITSGSLDLQSYANCCEGDNCKLDYYIPPDNEPENGVTCPFCYEDHNTNGCTPTEVVKCRGDTILCVEYQGTFRNPDGSQPGTSFQSCANALGFSNFSLFFGIEEIERKKFTIIPPKYGE